MSNTVIKLYSGNYFDIANPEASKFELQDIAHALSRLCRFNGHCPLFYSVAQHSVLVSEYIMYKTGDPMLSLCGLLHDASEAFIGDVVSPLKKMLPDYREIEQRVEKAIAKRFNLPFPFDPVIKHADLIMLRTEQKCVMFADDEEWAGLDGVEPLGISINEESPGEARIKFIEQYHYLVQMIEEAKVSGE